MSNTPNQPEQPETDEMISDDALDGMSGGAAPMTTKPGPRGGGMQLTSVEVETTTGPTIQATPVTIPCTPSRSTPKK